MARRGIDVSSHISARHDPETLSDADLVLCEGFKESSIPKLEVVRRAAHPTSLAEEGKIDVATLLAVVTDAPASIEGGRRFDLGEATWLEQLATFVQEWLAASQR